VASAVALRANGNLSNRGVCLFGSGFIVTREEARRLGWGRVPGIETVIREYRNGKDLTAKSRDVMVIDTFGKQPADIQNNFPEVYQWLLNRVKPERDHNKDKWIKENWWIHGRPRPDLREILDGLPRYIATVETAKHRFFNFLDASILPDNMLVNIALDDAFAFGVLSSRIHVVWALKVGGRLGMGNDPRYNKTRCFETFPFPDPTEEQKENIRALAEQLDTHRKRQQARHPDLTMTGMYNVLEKLRSGEALTAKDKIIHEQGLVSVLKQLHDELDRAVAAAYGWPADLPEEDILQNLVTLNHQRAAEEAQGHIRHLRPDYQNPQGPKATQEELLTTEDSDPPPDLQPLPTDLPKLDWPKTLPDQIRAVRTVLATFPPNPTPAQVTKCLKGARKAKVEEILGVLEELGT